MKLTINFIIGLLLISQSIFSQNFTKLPLASEFDKIKGFIDGIPAIADVNGDGFPDVLIPGAILYINQGNNHFKIKNSNPLTDAWNGDGALADVDGDGDIDALLPYKDKTKKNYFRLFLNDGIGNFSEKAETKFELQQNGTLSFFDVDGDDDQDLIITGKNVSNFVKTTLYINDGDGNFTEKSNPIIEGVQNNSLSISDVDGDGDSDFLITGLNNANSKISKLFINDGKGNFTWKKSSTFEGVELGFAAFSDVDNDSDMDVLITGQDKTKKRISKLYINDGEGNFIEKIDSQLEGIAYSSISFADIDGDKDDDLVMTGKDNLDSTLTKFYTNDGNGNFVENFNILFDKISNGFVEFIDFDNNGYKDLILIGQLSTGLKSSQVFVNYGEGKFIEATGVEFKNVYYSAIAFSDVDNDGDDDVIITGQALYEDDDDDEIVDHKSRLYINLGKWNFKEKKGLPFIQVYDGAVAFSDIDNDGDNDLLISGNRLSKLYINDGKENFKEKEQTEIVGVISGSIAFSDLNGDGFDDLFISGGSRSTNEFIVCLYLNDGHGNFVEKKEPLFIGNLYSSIAFGDIDGDGDNDLIGIKYSDYIDSFIIYKNDGNGNFYESNGTPDSIKEANFMGQTDVDGDGDIDVIISGYYVENKDNTTLFLNDGQGNFIEKKNTPFNDISFYNNPVFSDVDNDGDQDVIISGKRNKQNLTILFINDGLGNFVEKTGTSFQAVVNGAIAFSDIDNDNDNDLLITGNTNLGWGYFSSLYINDGIFSDVNEIKIFEELDINLFPNPTKTNILNLKFNFPEENFFEIKTFNLLGELLQMRNEFIKMGEQTIKLDISSFKPGIYFIQINYSNKSQLLKFIVE